MNSPSFFRTGLLFAALLFLSGPAAQAEQPAPTPPAKPAGQPASDLITIDFPGGALSKLAAKLNENDGAKLSIVQSPGLDPNLPAFSVRNVRVAAVIAALGRLLEPQGFELNPMDNNLAVLSKIQRGGGGGAFVSLQLGRKVNDTAGWTAEEVIAAIQLGTEFANPEGKSSTLRFKYHPATKLLFVAGTEREVDIAQRVFSSLSDGGPTKNPTPPPEKK
jgi:hypothetical protein